MMLAVVVSEARVCMAARKSIALPLLMPVDSSFEHDAMARAATTTKNNCFFISELIKRFNIDLCKFPPP